MAEMVRETAEQVPAGAGRERTDRSRPTSRTSVIRLARRRPATNGWYLHRLPPTRAQLRRHLRLIRRLARTTGSVSANKTGLDTLLVPRATAVAISCWRSSSAASSIQPPNLPPPARSRPPPPRPASARHAASRIPRCRAMIACRRASVRARMSRASNGALPNEAVKVADGIASTSASFSATIFTGLAPWTIIS